jgi:glycosyltransferase involved in cell wall biosynthesis
MNIAILGSRGIPAEYSGFETCAEELSVRLVERGHIVSVYCCSRYSTFQTNYYRGVKRIFLPTLRRKHLEKIIHVAISLFHVSLTKIDIVLVLGLNIPVLFWLPRIFNKKVFVNVDGLEWKRGKWGFFASRYLLWAERIAASFSNHVITDARCIQSYYLKKYGKTSTYIPYGAETEIHPPGKTLKQYALDKDGYILFVGRFEPENNPLLVREAYEMLEINDKKLVMIGDSPFSGEYVEKVRNTINKKVIFTGFLYGKGYNELSCNAYFYVQASEVGGTHPALVEAMGFGNCILANDVPEHREVLMHAGIYYRGKKELIKKMDYLLKNPEVVFTLKKRAQEIVKKNYSWEEVVTKYEKLFREKL